MVDERVVSWLRRRSGLVDVVLAATLLAGCVLCGILVGADVDYFVLSAVVLGPLAIRRRWPEGAAVGVAVGAFVQWVLIRDSTGALPADIAVPIAVYTLAAYGRGYSSRIGLAGGLIGAVLGGWSWPQLPMPVLAHVIVGAGLASTVLAAWLGGAWQRARRGELLALAERAELLERTRDQGMRLAVLSERTRIARDIHDILAHSLSVIVAQSDGGRYAAAREPRAAIDALTAIGEHGRRALVETRRAIGVLRADVQPETSPSPGFADIPRLVGDLRDAGLPVELALDVPEGIAEGIGLVVYRIVQEGLTNVVKHAGAGARAQVSIIQHEGWLSIGIDDNGNGSSVSNSPGYGLRGMRERVASHGGDIELRRKPDGHLLVARIPVRIEE
ncbi:sensor histidine kinase [Nocardia sp. NPDC058058]|uniref:sensor histidine kinase n=1 Tax=Nocardia sp. NPDC058058 TaxID=3346317 RepID=UPI0036DCAECF